jgi:hypothetical protein
MFLSASHVLWIAGSPFPDIGITTIFPIAPREKWLFFFLSLDTVTARIGIA